MNMPGEINYTLMRPGEMEQRKKDGNPFIKNVLQEQKLMIIGTCDDWRSWVAGAYKKVPVDRKKWTMPLCMPEMTLKNEAEFAV